MSDATIACETASVNPTKMDSPRKILSHSGCLESTLERNEVVSVPKKFVQKLASSAAASGQKRSGGELSNNVAKKPAASPQKNPEQLERARKAKTDLWPMKKQQMEEECKALGLGGSTAFLHVLDAANRDTSPRKATLMLYACAQLHHGNIEILEGDATHMIKIRVLHHAPFWSGLIGFFGYKAEDVQVNTQKWRNVNNAIEHWGFKPEGAKFVPKWKLAYLGQVAFQAA